MGHASAETKTSRDSSLMGRKNPSHVPHHQLLLAVEILGSTLPSLSFSFLFQAEEEVRLKMK